MTNVKQYKGQPRKDWERDDWLKHAWIQKDNPWLDEDDREYWRDKIAELSNH